ncbi:MAG: Glycine oxidase [Fimbriimonadaceae bacterium]|nr:Glycine oxidase [Fimbriimonadaceae bacterium]
MIAKKDVAIIGAGIVGSLIARELQSAGMEVVVIDPQPPGTGVTAEGMGHLVALDDSATQLSLTAYSLRLWRDLAEKLPNTVEFRPTGTLWVAEEADRPLLAAKVEAMAEGGVRAEVWDRDRLRMEEPMLSRSLVGGVWVPDDAVVYAPAAATWACAGLDRIPLAATSIEERGVRTDSGLIEAERIVIAAGNGSPRFLSGLGMRPRKGHLAITPRGYRISSRQIVELGYMRSAHGSDEDSVAFNIQPRATGQVLIGSSRQFGQTDRDIDRPLLARMLDRARQFVPALGVFPILRCWTGFRPTTADGLPRIGPLADNPNVVVATGHEGLGITTATATARLVAHHLAGVTCEIDPKPFLPRGVALA